MVLKRKLPSAMGGNAAAPAAQSDVKDVEKNKVQDQAPVPPFMEEKESEPSLKTADTQKSEDISAVEPPSQKPEFDDSLETVAVPIAPEISFNDSSMEASKESEGEMVMPVMDDMPAPSISSFGEESLEPTSKDSEMPTPPMSKEAASFEKPSESEGWSIDDLMAPPPAASKTEEEPMSMAAPESEAAGGMPPWQQGATGEPPILPGSADEAGDIEPKTKAFVGIGLLAVVAVGAYFAFVENGDRTTERLARITNALEEVSEEPLESAAIKPEKVQTADKKPQVVVEEVSEDNFSSTDSAEFSSFVDFPAQGESLEEVAVEEVPAEAMDAVIQKAQENVAEEAVEGEVAQTVVEFVDVPEDEVDELITGDKAKEMPEDVTNFVDRWKEAVESAEMKRKGQVAVVEDEAGEEIVQEYSPAEVEVRNEEKLQSLEDELAAYRRILAGEGGVEPKKVSPMTFFGGEGSAGSIPEPSLNDRGNPNVKTQGQAASMYGANPYNLPVVSEPEQKRLQKVRTLNDFDVTMFEPERERIRMPKNVKPAFNMAEFPDLYLLSLVPGQGVVAQMGSKQGVLMLGESVEGWELVSVALQYAEFRKGKRRQVLTLDGIR